MTGARVGERWKIGTVVLEVTSPRVPCWKLAKKMGDPFFIKRFAHARRPGAYLRIIGEGELGAGDEVEIVHRPNHDVTIALFVEAYEHDRALLPRLLDAGDASRTMARLGRGEARCLLEHEVVAVNGLLARAREQLAHL